MKMRIAKQELFSPGHRLHDLIIILLNQELIHWIAVWLSAGGAKQ